MALQASRAHKQMVEAFIRDMQESNEDKQLELQNKEFRKYLEGKLEQRHNDFFRSMLDKLNKGWTLTDNMVNALRKCMKEDKKREEEKNHVGTVKERQITLKLNGWIQGQLHLDSRVVTGVVKGETKKAWLVEGHADMLQDCAWCMRCGRVLTQPASYTIGMGEICADHMGVPYPSELNDMTAKEKRDYRKKVLGVLHNQKFTAWIPKAKAEELKPEGEKAQPKPKTKTTKTAKTTEKKKQTGTVSKKKTGTAKTSKKSTKAPTKK